MNDDSKLYELAKVVFDAFNEFLNERNRVLGIESPLTYISDEDGRTVVYTRGEYAEELIEEINKLHGLDPLKHRAFETAIQLATTADLVRELAGREGVTVDDAEYGDIQILYSDVSLGRIIDKVDGPATVLVVRGEQE
jgi:hypothetical protein